MTGTAISPIDQSIRLEQHERATLERDSKALAMSGLVPEYFRGKPADVLIAGLALRDVGVRLSVTTLGMVYVVKGKPGFMAQLQIALARRHGIDIQFDQAECDEESATVEIRDHIGWHAVTFTMADAIRANLPGQNPTYKTYPDRMLLARAITKAIGVYAPGVKFGFGAPLFDEEELGFETAEIVDTDVPAAPSPGRGDSTGAESAPAPAGSALVTPLERRLLHRVIDPLPNEVKAELKRRRIGACIPPLDSDVFTSAHGEQLLEMAGRVVIETRTEVVAEGKPPATEEVGGGSVDGPPATTYAKDEEPFS